MRAFVDLLRLKAQNGTGLSEFKTDYQSIFERMVRAYERGCHGAVHSMARGQSGSRRLDAVGDERVAHGTEKLSMVGFSGRELGFWGLTNRLHTTRSVFGRSVFIRCRSVVDKVALEWHSGSGRIANGFVSKRLPLSGFPTRSNRVAESIVSARNMVTLWDEFSASHSPPGWDAGRPVVLIRVAYVPYVLPGGIVPAILD